MRVTVPKPVAVVAVIVKVSEASTSVSFASRIVPAIVPVTALVVAIV